MVRLMDRLFRRWGTEMVLRQGSREWHFRGMLQHSGSKSLQNAQWRLSPLGQLQGERYVYIGPAIPAPRTGDMLICRGETYELRQSEQVMLGNRPVYNWGLCVRKDGVQ